MTPATHSKPKAKRLPPVTREEYAAFIGQIELSAIWLEKAAVTNLLGPGGPKETADIDIEMSESGWRPSHDGFDAWHGYRFQIRVGDAALAEVNVTYGLRFTLPRPMSDTLFAIFRDANLPVNTWPFAREFLSTMMGRMGWLPFTLPALKLGTPPFANETEPSGEITRPHRRDPRARQVRPERAGEA